VPARRRSSSSSSSGARAATWPASTSAERAVLNTPLRTEADFDAALRALRDRPLLDRALALGARAERLAWVFAAGYQSAVAACFPEFDGPGLSCFAATTREGAEPCRLEEDGDDWRLHGEKTWIAAVDHVARLVVAVDGPDGPAFVQVDRAAPGLALANPGPARFLTELSQGTARFDGVRIASGALVAEANRARRFRSAEPLFVCAALAARMDCAEAIAAARILRETLDDREATKAGLESLRAALRTAVPRFEAEGLPGLPAELRSSFTTDRRLLQMFVRLD
jgi:hypothetical protein